ncbi:MAG: VWA domain-containing protein [Hyphomicrobium sp.]|jgi:mxaL protein|nr:VWA domain-containing protein [Hyphomicrobium sp.]
MIEFLNRKAARRWLLITAFLLSAIAAFGWSVRHSQDLVDALAIVDVTGSMLVRDVDKGSQNRLEAARSTIVELAQALPCSSRLGLGIFTERRSFVLFDPVEVCANYDAFSGAVAGLDWRMAWEGDSYIAKGLYSAIDEALPAKSNLLFVTDGHEAPPLPASGVPDFEGKPGEVKGVILGVGGRDKSPIPKFDDDGREVGVYGVGDVPHDNRHGLPGKSASSAEGWHPRNAPFGGQAAVGEEHLSSLRSEHLKDLAQRTGLIYAEQQNGAHELARTLRSVASRSSEVDTDISSLPALVALSLLALLYAIAWRANASRLHPASH